MWHAGIAIAISVILLIVGITLILASLCDSWCARSFVSLYYLPRFWQESLAWLGTFMTAFGLVGLTVTGLAMSEEGSR
jgi:hypothetical protein